ncbi:hypothetical protein QO004_000738 [Rhizobium mesoamericanum]|nr:hypothetical protein [Rhizobium mesoamericanum]
MRIGSKVEVAPGCEGTGECIVQAVHLGYLENALRSIDQHRCRTDQAVARIWLLIEWPMTSPKTRERW